ncbi:hypothetical protein D9M70_505240 [compost metagenome]
MCPAENAGHRAGSARKLADVAGDVGGDRAGFTVCLFKDQRFDAILGLGDENEIRGEQDKCNRAACHRDQFGRQRFGLELEHEILTCWEVRRLSPAVDAFRNGGELHHGASDADRHVGGNRIASTGLLRLLNRLEILKIGPTRTLFYLLL